MITAGAPGILDFAVVREDEERVGGAFALFVLTNAVLFLRPMDIVPALGEAHLYEVLIVACVLAALPKILGQLVPGSLYVRPITVCVLLMLPAVLLSHLTHGAVGDALAQGAEFAKLLVYYLLLVATVDTPRRLRFFLRWLAVFVVGLTVLPLLHYHGIIHNEALSPVRERDLDEASGYMVVLDRLRGAGIFQDPNDLCQMLGVGLILCLHWARSALWMPVRLFWMGAFAVLGDAVTLTASRGGLLAVLAGLGTLFYCRYGLKRTLAIAMVALPLMVVFVGGRQMEISASSDTGQQRIRIWSDGLALVKQAPVFGVGMNNFAKGADLVAHNSFLHCFAELGFLGGTLFLGVFALAVAPLHRPRGAIGDAQLAQVRATLLAVVVAYAAGMLSLSRSYVVPTYMILGLAAAWQAMAQPWPVSPYCCDGRLLRRMAALGVGFLLGMHFFVRASVRWH